MEKGRASVRGSQTQRKQGKARASGECRVFLVADRPVIRASLAQVLKKAGFELVGQAGGREETMTHPGLASSDVVVVSLLSGDGDAVSLVKAFRARRKRSVICAVGGNSECIRIAFAAGAGGYVTQSDESAHLLEAVRVVVGGRHYVSPRAGAGLARKISGLDKAVPEDDLSKKQLYVFKRLGLGEDIHEIARQMRISARTVESYCYRMIEKFDLDGMKALRRHAIANAAQPAM